MSGSASRQIRKASKPFSEEEVRELISLVDQKRMVLEGKDEGPQSRDLKNQAWKSIASTPNKTFCYKLGARRYRYYSEAQLQECLEKISRGEITQSQGEKEYGIPRRTLFNKRYRKHAYEIGRPTVYDELS
ncbi:hypothetical protein WDU94_010763 [Cyamophila willieti]